MHIRLAYEPSLPRNPPDCVAREKDYCLSGNIGKWQPFTLHNNGPNRKCNKKSLFPESQVHRHGLYIHPHHLFCFGSTLGNSRAQV